MLYVTLTFETITQLLVKHFQVVINLWQPSVTNMVHLKCNKIKSLSYIERKCNYSIQKM